MLSTLGSPLSAAWFGLRRRVLALLKVPPEPHPPMGDLASLRIFHAGRNYLKLRLAVWGMAQVLALAGLLFWTAMLIEVETVARTRQAAPTAVSAEPGESASPARPPSDVGRRIENWAARFADSVKSAATGWDGYKQILVEIGLLLPAWAFPLIWGVKIFSFVVYFVQLPVTYAVRRLDYEMRWYMVTDRSLRLRHGVWKVLESTMSFANIQQVTVTQGPVQRLLGLGDVKVQSAGGGSKEQHQHPGEDMHQGLFHSVTNGPEIRDLILDRLRRFRESGLGNPDEPSLPAAVAPGTAPSDALAAAQELLAEARALRVALS
jgi:membrane protein YdbS with pleckstrin-like domain